MQGIREQFRQWDNWVAIQTFFGIQVYDWVNSQKQQYTSINVQPELEALI
jgi:hypothetical protein